MTRAKPKVAPTAPTHPAVALPAGPYVDRVTSGRGLPRVVVLPSGLAMIEALAANGSGQNRIASALGISSTKFKTMLAADDGENEIRLAYERGHSVLEDEVAQYLLTSMRKGNVIAAIFFSKARLGWTENPPPPPTQVGIQILIPDSASDDEAAAARVARRRMEVSVITDQSEPQS